MNENIFEKENEKKEIDEFNGILYHYTSVEGMIGIIESNVIFATSFPFLNDSSEIVYGRRLAKNILINKITTEKDDITKKIYEECLNLNGVDKKRIYITCFCEKGNLLSQWRGYGQSGNGFSVGLESNKMNRMYRKSPYDEVYVKKVIYDLKTQTKTINKYLEHAVMYAKSKKITDIAEIKKIAKLTDWEIDKHSAFFKDEAFSEEKEWRAVYYGSSKGESLETKFRGKSNRIVDYKEFSFSPDALEDLPYKDKLPLKKIFCGPGVDHESQIVVIKELLKSRGYDYNNIDIEYSTIPFKIL